MIELRNSKGDVLLPLRVRPGARGTRIEGVREGALRVAVSAPADQGRANHAVCKFIAQILECRKSAITIHAGSTNRNKQVRIENQSLDEVRSSLFKHIHTFIQKGTNSR